MSLLQTLVDFSPISFSSENKKPFLLLATKSDNQEVVELMLPRGRLEVDCFDFLEILCFHFLFFSFLLVFYFFSIIVSRDVATGAVGGGLDGRRGRGGRTVPRQRHLTETWLTPDDDLIFQSSVKMP